MREKLVVIDLNQFDSDQRAVCSSCRAEGPGVCTIAQLEHDLARRPTTFDASEAGVIFTKIPSTCPNKYKEPQVAEQL